MESNTIKQSNVNTLPQMPAPFQKITAHTPWFVTKSVVALALNQLFKTACADDTLAFLINKKVAVNLLDSGIKFSITSDGKRIIVLPYNHQADLKLSGTVYAMMLLMSQQADADGLFFKRQLLSEGDTELGLFVKNFLSSIDSEQSKLHHFSLRLSHKLVQLIDAKGRLFSQLKANS